VPLAVGSRGSCSTNVNDSYVVRGDYLEGWPFSPTNPPQTAAPAGPVQLEAASDLVILLRVVSGQVERMRSVAADCPLDAGGRTVVWLQGVTPADSLKYLDGFLRPNTGITPAQEQRLSEAAVSAIALHRDAAADTILDRLATGPTNNDLRKQARTALGSTRGAHGFDILQKLIAAEQVIDIRRQLVSALGQTRQPGTADALLQIARRDTDARTRAEAIYWVPQRGGQRVVADVRGIMAADPSDDVRQRAVKGLARLPTEESIPLLIDLARTDKSPLVRKEAVSALSSSRDPRALAYLETLVK
jgi:HEAT repeat protein